MMVFQGSIYALRSLPRTPSAQPPKQPEGDAVIKGNKSARSWKVALYPEYKPFAYGSPFQCPEARKQPKQPVRQPWPV